MKHFSIKNWNTFQHFKDRSPPWIKLYRYLLDDPDWHALDGESAKALVMLWLIASEDHGRLPDIRKIAFRLRVAEKKASQLLIDLSQWLIRDDIAPISDCHQDDAPETETYRKETETETERETEARAPDGAQTVREPLVAVLGEELADGVIDHRKRLRKPLTPFAAKLLAGKFQSCPDPPAAAQAMIANGWQGIEPSWIKPNAKSDLQRRTSLAREFLNFPDGGTQSGGAGGDQAAAGEALAGVSHRTG